MLVGPLYQSLSHLSFICKEQKTQQMSTFSLQKYDGEMKNIFCWKTSPLSEVCEGARRAAWRWEFWSNWCLAGTWSCRHRDNAKNQEKLTVLVKKNSPSLIKGPRFLDCIRSNMTSDISPWKIIDIEGHQYVYNCCLFPYVWEKVKQYIAIEHDIAMNVLFPFARLKANNHW